jgi:hypothetical protein
MIISNGEPCHLAYIDVQVAEGRMEIACLLLRKLGFLELFELRETTDRGETRFMRQGNRALCIRLKQPKKGAKSFPYANVGLAFMVNDPHKFAKSLAKWLRDENVRCTNANRGASAVIYLSSLLDIGSVELTAQPKADE